MRYHSWATVFWKSLDKKLKQIGNGICVFGGFSIICSRDFRQLELVCSNDSKLLFSSLSNGLWDNSINVVIILDNNHCFKEDPEHGFMLKKCGFLTTFEGKQCHMNKLQTYLNYKSFYLKPEYFTLMCLHRWCLLCLSNKQRT